MRLADAIVSRAQRIQVRADDMESRRFVDVIPAQLERATILEATSVHDFLLPESRERLSELPSLRVIPPWHLTFVEMRISRWPKMDAGLLFVRKEQDIDAIMLLRDAGEVIAPAVFHSHFDPTTGVLVGKPRVGLLTDDPTASPQAFLPAFATGLYAFALSHCKNVNVVERQLPAKVASKLESKMGRKPLRYHVLDIASLVRRAREEVSDSESEIARALHICRGHFRTYSEQRKLFGRVAGTFWIDEHARGQESSGTLVKDYSIGETSCVV